VDAQAGSAAASIGAASETAATAARGHVPVSQRFIAGQRQPQAPPQQPPTPWAPGAGEAAGRVAVPPTDTADSSFTVSSWPSGHVHGADDSLIGRLRSNVSPQVRHRYS